MMLDRNRVLRVVAKHFGTSVEQITAPTRGMEHVSMARTAFCWLMRKDCTDGQIAAMIGRCRSSVSYSLHRAFNHMDSPWFRNRIGLCEEELKR